MQASPIMREQGLEDYFSSFRDNIIGEQQHFESPFGIRRIIYADWTASGRAYKPIEAYIQHTVLPFAGNTHTTTTVTGNSMSLAYDTAKTIIKAHVNAGMEDVLLFCGSGMTAAVNKLQRILGMRIPEHMQQLSTARPVVFVTAMEHHSNHISWLETIADVVIIRNDTSGHVDLHHLSLLLEQYKERTCKIAAVTACSNVTGIQTPYHEIAQLVHAYNGFCFVDFACSAAYCNINMHPEEAGAHLDAIYFSGHKFLGGPGTPGVLIFHQQLYHNQVPDQPGGGTVLYTNPWGERVYVGDIEQREDGGTPPYLQAIKLAMCIRLKEEMGVHRILQREQELLEIIFSRLAEIKSVQVLAGHVTRRLGLVSFLVTGVHYNLMVRLLNDRFGIQLRGGCSCAGTYGHYLLDVDQARSYAIRDAINTGDLSCKPGWVRLSIHPTMTDAEVNFILDAIEITVANVHEWAKDYYYAHSCNEYFFKGAAESKQPQITSWFDTSSWNDC